MYVISFAFYEGLKRITDDVSDGPFGIFDGVNWDYRQTGSSLWDTITLFLRYGFEPLKLNWLVDNMLNSFKSIYNIQNEGKAFTSPRDMLAAMGGQEFVQLPQMTLADYLLSKGFSLTFINELAAGAARVNYGQNTTMGGFAGLVSLAGSQSGLWSVLGGNNQVCYGLLKRSGVRVNYNSRVSRIRRISSPGKTVYELTIGNATRQFDIVILASPIEKANITFVDFPVTPKPNGIFQQTIATFVEGSLNRSYFHLDGISASEFPTDVLTTEGTFFNSIGKESSVNNTLPSIPVYKVFSRDALQASQYESLFNDSRVMTSKVWLAYPHYNPPHVIPSFVLDDQVFYVNAIEWVASAMEMISISARNAALLTAGVLHNVSPFDAPPTEPTMESKRDEL